MIEIEHVSKTYGTKKHWRTFLWRFSKVRSLVFLGHNGAGKSTTIKSLVSILQPTSGEIVFWWQSISPIPRRNKKNRLLMSRIHRTCFCSWPPENIGIWSQLLMKYRNPKKGTLKWTGTVIWYDDACRRNASQFFPWYAAKTILIGALLPDPDIWILDEPLQGLDPQAAFDLKRNDESTCCERQNGYFLDACLGYCPTALWSVSYFEKRRIAL